MFPFQIPVRNNHPRVLFQEHLALSPSNTPMQPPSHQPLSLAFFWPAWVCAYRLEEASS